VADNLTVTPLPIPADLSIDDVAVAEGNSGTATLGFTVSLSAVSDQTVTVGYATADGTATTADGDYVAASGTLTFAPGVTTQPVSVTVNGDVKNEANETLSVNLSGPANATILDSQGIGTITNDDASPTGTAYYSVSPCRVLDSRVTTGPWGGQPLGAQQERTVAVVAACAIPATAKALSFNVTATAATAGGHIRVYPAGTPRPGTSSLNFAAGQTRANNGIVSLGPAGDLAFFSGQASGSVHVVLDVNGYLE
jgi:mRNA-degrading endonuclease toxin of MazEF toxin-antitoxin module